MDAIAKAAWVDCIFLFALVWSVGACTDSADRPKFDLLLRKLIANQPLEEYKQYVTAPARKVAASFPDGKLVFDFVFKKDRGKWTTWIDLVDDMFPPSDADFEKIIVPTADSARYIFLMDALVTHELPLLLAGPTGTGKSVYIKQYLMRLDPEKQLYIPCSKHLFWSMTVTVSKGQWCLCLVLHGKDSPVLLFITFVTFLTESMCSFTNAIRD
eukprot:Gb_13540 [translate_table: standard]